jgi:AraC-like DNA-binding protein
MQHGADETRIQELLLPRLVEEQERLLAGASRPRVPRRAGLMQSLERHHYHFHPEVFLQISGATEFRLPEESFRLEAGESAILPTGMPHAERCREGPGEPFRNLVIMADRRSVRVHAAVAGRNGRPQAYGWSERVPAEPARLPGLIEDAADDMLRGGPASPCRRGRGLLVAFLAEVEALFRQGDEDLNAFGESRKVRQCRHQIEQHLGDQRLSVAFLAARIGCTADYLSDRFHEEAGERLSAYINRCRIEQARRLLDGTNLNVSEIARACGYASAGYFSRRFRRETGVTPSGHRSRASDLSAAAGG